MSRGSHPRHFEGRDKTEFSLCSDSHWKKACAQALSIPIPPVQAQYNALHPQQLKKSKVQASLAKLRGER